MPSSSLGWNQEPNTMLDAVKLVFNSGNIMTAWGGGCYDTTRDRLIVWGGGHNDYNGNEVYAISLAGTPSVARLNDSTATGCSQITCDGGITPNSRHTYHNIEYSPFHDIMFAYSGALSGFGTTGTDAWAFHFSTLTWEYLNPISTGPLPIPQAAQVSVSYDPVTHKFWMCDGKSIHSYDYATKTFVGHYVSTNGFIVYPCTVLDPVRRKLFITDLGVPYISLWVVDLNNPSAGPGSITPTGATGVFDTNAWAYDPVSGDVVIWNGGNTVYRFNTATYVSTALNYTGGPGAGQLNGTYGRWNYSPAQGVFIIANSFTQNAYTFRVGTSVPDTTPPTTPSSPSATAISQSRIDLGWSASTDAVGVTGYLIERCQGAACSGFAQIISVTTLTYSDIGLTAGTLYRYRIRATDAAGNLSPYSSIVEATTTAVDIIPPTDPSSLVATVISSSEIDLAWVASTDAIGVAGYRVERAEAAGSYSQIAAPASNAYADTGLSQNTLYHHKVRAIDAAGNLSGYSNITSATTTALTVRNAGTGQTYATLQAAFNAAVDGDDIEITAGDYHNEVLFVPTTLNNWTLRGVGGMARLIWDTGDYRTATTHIGNGKGIIVVNGLGSNLIENIEVLGAIVDDGNGAGIRYQGAGNLTLRNVYAHDSQNGILGAGVTDSTLLMEYCRFETNGYFDGTFYSHNIYIGLMGRFIMQYCTSLDPTDGHCVKSRARFNLIQYNHISTKNSTGSMEIEFPNGHQCIVLGNKIEQGVNSGNSTIVSYGAEGLDLFGDVLHELYVVNNTFYDWRGTCTFIQFVFNNAYPDVYKAYNNLRNHTNTFRLGTPASITESNNPVETNDAKWVNVATGDFNLVTGATAIDAGTPPGIINGIEAVDLFPRFEYVPVANKTGRPVVGVLDAGAYEYGTSTDGIPRIGIAIRG